MSTGLPANQNQQNELSVPAHLQLQAGGTLADYGMDLLSQYVLPPRLKIIQPQTTGELAETYNKGDVIVSPNNVLMSPVILNDKGKPSDIGEVFYVVPLFFFPEYILWNPLASKGMNYQDGTPMYGVRERSLNPLSDLAMKAKTPRLRVIPCPEMPKEVCRYVEHLNYVVMIMFSDQFYGTPMVMSFSKGEHKTGTKWAGDIKLRKTYPWGQVWQVHTKFRKRDQWEWYGYNITQPIASSGFPRDVENVDEFNAFTALHNQYKETHAKGLLIGMGDDDNGNGDDENTFTSTATATDPNAPREY